MASEVIIAPHSGLWASDPEAVLAVLRRYRVSETPVRRGLWFRVDGGDVFWIYGRDDRDNLRYEARQALVEALQPHIDPRGVWKWEEITIDHSHAEISAESWVHCVSRDSWDSGSSIAACNDMEREYHRRADG